MRRLTLVVATSVVMIAVLGGCGTSEVPTESIVGTWVSGGGKYLQFRDDGTYQVGRGPSTGDMEWGTWSIEGNILTKTPAEISPYCAGIVGIYEVEVRDDGSALATTVREDPCGSRQADLGSTVLLTRYTDAGS